MPHSTERSPRAPAHDALHALLDTEATLRIRAESAAAEAKRIVDDATARAAAAEHANAATIARELAGFQAAHERAAHDALARIAEDARADAARFTAVTDARVQELAALVVTRVLQG